MAQYNENTVKDLREVGRQAIRIDEVNGNFEVDSEEIHFESTIVTDVSVSGAGIELPVALPIGAQLDLTFTAGDWKVTARGKVVWCRRFSMPGLSGDWIEAFRLGIKFDDNNANNNVVFFMASRSMMKKTIS